MVCLVFSGEKKKGCRCLIDKIDMQSLFRLERKKKDLIKGIHRVSYFIRPLLRDCRVNDFCNLCVVACKSTDRVYTAFRLLESIGELRGESTGELLTHSQRTGFIQHFAA